MEALGTSITHKYIMVLTHEGEVKVNRDDFNEWADEEQKREWLSVHADYKGESVEEEGVMPWADYYIGESFFKDITEYIIFKDLKVVQ